MGAKIVIGVLLLLAFVRPADAQIYTWRDANGTLVLSNVPQGGAAPPKSFRRARLERRADDRLRVP